MKKKKRLRIPEGVKCISASYYQKLIQGSTTTSAISDGRPEVRKPSKQKNQILHIDGIKFDSKVEARRFSELKFMKEKSLIKDFERQVKFHLLNGVPKLFRAKTYVADFVVYNLDGTIDVEDVKSSFTRKDKYYRLKKHLMFDLHNILIKEITYK